MLVNNSEPQADRLYQGHYDPVIRTYLTSIRELPLGVFHISRSIGFSTTECSILLLLMRLFVWQDMDACGFFLTADDARRAFVQYGIGLLYICLVPYDLFATRKICLDYPSYQIIVIEPTVCSFIVHKKE